MLLQCTWVRNNSFLLFPVLEESFRENQNNKSWALNYHGTKVQRPDLMIYGKPYDPFWHNTYNIYTCNSVFLPKENLRFCIHLFLKDYTSFELKRQFKTCFPKSNSQNSIINPKTQMVVNTTLVHKIMDDWTVKSLCGTTNVKYHIKS